MYYIHLPGRSFSLTIVSFIGFLSSFYLPRCKVENAKKRRHKSDFAERLKLFFCDASESKDVSVDEF